MGPITSFKKRVFAIYGVGLVFGLILGAISAKFYPFRIETTYMVEYASEDSTGARSIFQAELMAHLEFHQRIGFREMVEYPTDHVIRLVLTGANQEVIDREIGLILDGINRKWQSQFQLFRDTLAKRSEHLAKAKQAYDELSRRAQGSTFERLQVELLANELQKELESVEAGSLGTKNHDKAVFVREKSTRQVKTSLSLYFLGLMAGFLISFFVHAVVFLRAEDVRNQKA